MNDIAQSRFRVRQIINPETSTRLMNPAGTKWHVSLHKPPQVGETMLRIVKGKIEAYTVANVGRYKDKGRGDRPPIIYWIRNKDGKLFVSGVRRSFLKQSEEWEAAEASEYDIDVHTHVAQQTGITKKPKKRGRKELFEREQGDKRKLIVLHKNPLSQAIVAKYIPMTLVYRHPKLDADYWQDEQGNPYWGRKGSKEVRPFPVWIDLQQWINTTGNQINCSG
jgi:hypothetical protein